MYLFYYLETCYLESLLFIKCSLNKINYMKILIINSGGNILSLKNILLHCGFEVKIYEDKDILSNFDLVFLPGIGSFDKVIENLKK